MAELERDKAEIAARMAQAPADVPDVHPNIASVYRRNVERFTEALNDPDGGRQAAEALRSLIGEIVQTPGPKRGEVHAELRGELMGILTFATEQKPKQNIRFMLPVASCGVSAAYCRTGLSGPVPGSVLAPDQERSRRPLLRRVRAPHAGGPRG